MGDVPPRGWAEGGRESSTNARAAILFPRSIFPFQGRQACLPLLLDDGRKAHRFNAGTGLVQAIGCWNCASEYRIDQQALMAWQKICRAGPDDTRTPDTGCFQGRFLPSRKGRQPARCLHFNFLAVVKTNGDPNRFGNSVQYDRLRFAPDTHGMLCRYSQWHWIPLPAISIIALPGFQSRPKNRQDKNLFRRCGSQLHKIGRAHV